MRTLLLIGGSAGSGKTTVARTLADELGGGWLQLDTVWVALRAAARGTPAYSMLDVPARIGDPDASDEDVLAAHVAAAEAVCAVLPDVLGFELETHDVLVADGAWVLPSFAAGLALPGTDVRSVHLQHADTEGVAAALAPRLGGRPPQERHRLGNRRIWHYGEWLGEQARAHGLPVLDPLPWETLTSRVRVALGLEPAGPQG